MTNNGQMIITTEENPPEKVEHPKILVPMVINVEHFKEQRSYLENEAANKNHDELIGILNILDAIADELYNVGAM